MKSGNEGFAPRAYLLMLSRGGRWNAQEVGNALGTDTDSAHWNLASMARAGQATRHAPGQGSARVQFSVNIDSTIPRGTKLRLVDAALKQAGGRAA